MDGPPDAGAGTGLRAGGERARGHQHGPRRGRDRCPGPRLVVEPRHQPDGRGDELPGRFRAADGPHRRHAWRTGARQHRSLAVRLLPGDQGPWSRRLPRAGACPVLDRRGGRAHRGRLRDRRTLPDAGDDPRRRGHGPGDGAGRPGLPDARPDSLVAGSSRAPSIGRRGSSARSISGRRTSRRTTGDCRRSSPRSPSARSAGRASTSRTPRSSSSPTGRRRASRARRSSGRTSRACAPASSDRSACGRSPRTSCPGIAGIVRAIVVVEMSAGQMVEDVRLAVEGRTPVFFHGRTGGMVPTPGEVVDALSRAWALTEDRAVQCRRGRARARPRSRTR